jgi:F-type H+-transporting ATPase subunit epsilon
MTTALPGSTIRPGLDLGPAIREDHRVATIRCKLITPEAALIDDEVSYASVPAWDGLVGLLSGGAPLVAKLGMGQLRLDFPDSGGAKGGSRWYYVQEGFMKFANNELTILANDAVPAENLIEADCATELRTAETRGVPDDATNQLAEMDKITKARNAARAKLNLARSFKHKGI